MATRTDGITSQIKELRSEIMDRLDRIEGELTPMQKAIGVLKDRSDNEEQYCPMRVEIARAVNGNVEARRIADKALEVAQTNRLTLAGSGGLGGAIGAGLVWLAERLLQGT